MGNEITTERRSAYIDDSGTRQPAWRRRMNTGSVLVYGNHLIGNFISETGLEMNLEVTQGRLWLFAFDDDNGHCVEFSRSESRRLLLAALHQLDGKTRRAAGVLGATPKFFDQVIGSVEQAVAS